jgi:hypothetical protein
MTARVKLRFPYENSAGENETETMWALKREDGYEIDNIPFYVKGLALGDVVSARAEADGTLWFSELVRSSGHSTIQLWFSDEHDVQPIRDELKRMGCASEVSDLPRLVAVDVAPGVSYVQVKGFLDQSEHAGTFEYQEACLGSMAPHG